MDINTACVILGVNVNTTHENVRQAYRKRIRLIHPDRFSIGTTEWEDANGKQCELNEAYDLIKRVVQVEADIREDIERQDCAEEIKEEVIQRRGYQKWKSGFIRGQKRQSRRQQKTQSQPSVTKQKDSIYYVLFPLVLALFKAVFTERIDGGAFPYFWCIVLPVAAMVNFWRVKDDSEPVFNKISLVCFWAVPFGALYYVFLLVFGVIVKLRA